MWIWANSDRTLDLLPLTEQRARGPEAGQRALELGTVCPTASAHTSAASRETLSNRPKRAGTDGPDRRVENAACPLRRDPLSCLPGPPRVQHPKSCVPDPQSQGNRDGSSPTANGLREEAETPRTDKATPFTPEGIWPPPHLSQVVSFGCHVPRRHCWAQARLAGAFWTRTLFICSETPVLPQDVAIENLPGCAWCPGLREGRILRFPERHPRPLQTLSQGDLRGLPEEQDGAPPQARQRPPGRGAENLLFSPV